MIYTAETTALATAFAASVAAAKAQYVKEGSADYGSCGGSVMDLKCGSRLYKAASEFKPDGYTRPLAFGDGFIMLSLPEGVRTQSANVFQAMYGAFYASLKASGFDGSVKRFWNYID